MEKYVHAGIVQVTIVFHEKDCIAKMFFNTIPLFPLLFSFFLFFSVFSVVYFSHRRSARIKKLIQRKLFKMANNLGIDPFQDPVGHFGGPWRPFWILQAVWRCRRCGVAGGERVPPGRRQVWYFIGSNSTTGYKKLNLGDILTHVKQKYVQIRGELRTKNETDLALFLKF